MGCVILLSTTVPGGTLWFLPSSSSFLVGKNLVWCRFCTTRNVTMGVYSGFNEVQARLIAFTSLFKTYNIKCNGNTRKSITQISVQEIYCCVEQEISNFRNTYLGVFFFIPAACPSKFLHPSTHPCVKKRENCTHFHQLNILEKCGFFVFIPAACPSVSPSIHPPMCEKT